MTTPGKEGRFEGFDVLTQTGHWDPVTEGVVRRRLASPGPPRFFTAAETEIARSLLDRLLGQDVEPRIDVLADIDSRLAGEVTDGWHFADMPHDGPAWRKTLSHVDADAQARFDAPFAQLSHTQQAAIVQAVQDRIGADWHGLSARHVWSLWTRYACAAFYAHPWAWNEIGFGGPAYPRGYKNIGVNRREPWERPERDAHDPVPWADRVEAARRAQLEAFGRQ
jgi:hypothetical protein